MPMPDDLAKALHHLELAVTSLTHAGVPLASTPDTVGRVDAVVAKLRSFTSALLSELDAEYRGEFFEAVIESQGNTWSVNLERAIHDVAVAFGDPDTGEVLSPGEAVAFLWERGAVKVTPTATKVEKELTALGVDVLTVNREVGDDPSGPHLGKVKKPNRVKVRPVDPPEGD